MPRELGGELGAMTLRRGQRRGHATAGRQWWRRRSPRAGRSCSLLSGCHAYYHTTVFEITPFTRCAVRGVLRNERRKTPRWRLFQLRGRSLALVVSSARSWLTSDSRNRRWPPGVRIEPIRPAVAQRVTVLGSTRNSAATSPGVSSRPPVLAVTLRLLHSLGGHNRVTLPVEYSNGCQ